MTALVSLNHIMGALSVLHGTVYNCIILSEAQFSSISVYPWNNVRTVCDVGSGLGPIILSLAPGNVPSRRGHPI